ncbi:Fmu (Sun) domain protein [Chloroherpeton thalassium ATCC 35110]|uniref:Fmu (Sun) domain protein n=1 Tax=Chloroherpeton thalassium (strain ATCC 35110 / GB-78) TaxID=517418 RepID=B3QX20_CHLT3|nr:class I SAM-dependent rRNA methyltransferase [Chloroherpeton thalassium]ACF14830.1 Fmu (Sun) domain protein [Chloroherpeton thalassium ATCC 35110]
MESIYLNKNEERRLLNGHQWIFSNELKSVPKDIEKGSVVKVFSAQNKFLGIGFYNPHSLISFRFLSKRETHIDQLFFESRILRARDFREKIYPKSTTNAYRLVHAESDFLPGLIIDKFDNSFSIQTFSAGMENHIQTICDVLIAHFSPENIVLRNESQLRELENLPQEKKVLLGNPTDLIRIYDTEIQYDIDILNGHKTGFFLDQRENRKRIRPFAQDAHVLDIFTSDGGFSLNAAYGKAKEILAVDISEEALKRAHHNAEINQLKIENLIKEDAFSFIEKLEHEERKFDLVILDPPSLTKSKKTVSTAIHAYKKLNRSAIKLVKKGGFLATASCSHHVGEDLFLSIVQKAANDAHRKVQLIERAAQAPDHPVLISMPETQYLKFAIFHVS